MAAAGRIGYPVALKAASPDIAHKTETGLVKLNLRTGAEFAAAWRELEGILALHHADARREGMLVQGMVRSAGGKSGDVVETIVGVNRDGGFGSISIFWTPCRAWSAPRAVSSPPLRKRA